MKKELTIRISGEAGQGIDTTAFTLIHILKKAGFNLFLHMDYMSRVRGGDNFMQIRMSESPVHSFRKTTDLLVAFNMKSAAIHAGSVHKAGVIVCEQGQDNAFSDKRIFDVPLSKLASEAAGAQLFQNVVALGAAVSLTGIPVQNGEAVIRDFFSGKGEEIIGKNIAAFRAGFDFAAGNAGRRLPVLEAQALPAQLLLNGNEAIGLGALSAGLKFYSAYPMTPSTSIMNTIAAHGHRYGVVVEQAEDEIAAINMAIGASAAGVRAMTGSSGGGFALMTEGVSLAGMTETPVVIAVAGRPGPATGLPTRTEQADLNLVLYAGHGEFCRAVFTPGTIEECFYLTRHAFNIAEKYQIPVFILTDQYLADAVRNTPPFDMSKYPAARYIIPREESLSLHGYNRYSLTPDGISPRAIPGFTGEAMYIDSDEHTQAGHITESAEDRVAMMEKRYFRRMKLLEREVMQPVVRKRGEPEIYVAGFGSTARVLLEAWEETGDDRIGIIHLPQVWPFPAKKLASLAEGKIFVTFENNAGAQLAGLVRQTTGIKADHSILKYDGRAFSLEETIAALKKLSGPEKGKSGKRTVKKRGKK